MHHFIRAALVAGLFLLAAFPAPILAQENFPTTVLAQIDDAITQAVQRKDAPGAVVWLEHDNATYHRAYGRRAVVPAIEEMTEDSIFDAASLTKSIATAPSVMLLLEAGQLQLDAPVRSWLAEFSGDGREHITLRQLLTHTSGLRPSLSVRSNWLGYAKGIELACAEKPQTPPGTAFRYSDINFILLGEIVRRVSGQTLDEFAATRVFQPLKMDNTRFRPPPAVFAQIAPTEQADGKMLRGVVHDPTARRMDGVAGHAGLFTTAGDLARFCRMLIHEGELDGVRVFKRETVRLMTTVQSPPALEAKRGLGWDIDTGYSKPRGDLFPIGSFGHTGFTGTSVWIDPTSRTFVILLASRLHPDGKGNMTELRAAVGTLAAEAVGLSRPRTNSSATVLNGIDVLKKQSFAPLKKLRLGLITNHTGTDREKNPTIDLLFKAPDVQLRALFSPEHGIRGKLDQAKINDTTDEATGLPVFSLYGERRAPSPEQLKDLDALAFDIQDIGCRFYTYASTLGHCLEAAGKAGKKFFVLDRVNPIGGVAVEGPIHEGKSTFVAYHRAPLRHGMTIGELAQMFNTERKFNVDLTVIRLEGWRRSLWFDETALPWINPSPNMRSLTEATLYPGVGLLESAVSVGRGTDTPFEVIGAPYVDEVNIAAELNRASLPGVAFTPIRFTPTASIFKDKDCGGVKMTVTNRAKLNAVDVGIMLAQTFHRLYPKDFAIDKMKHLLESDPTLEAIKAGKSLAEIKQMWSDGLKEFTARRQEFLIYE